MSQFPQCRHSNYLWVALVLFALTVKAVHGCAQPQLEQFMGASGASPFSHESHEGMAHHGHAALVTWDDFTRAESATSSCCPGENEPICGAHCADGEQLKGGYADFKAQPFAYFVHYLVTDVPMPYVSLDTRFARLKYFRAPLSPSLNILYQVFTI